MISISGRLLRRAFQMSPALMTAGSSKRAILGLVGVAPTRLATLLAATAGVAVYIATSSASEQCAGL